MNNKKAQQELKAARRDLDAQQRRQEKAGVRDETPAFSAANDRVRAAEKNVSWWRR